MLDHNSGATGSSCFAVLGGLTCQCRIRHDSSDVPTPTAQSQTTLLGRHFTERSVVTLLTLFLTVSCARLSPSSILQPEGSFQGTPATLETSNQRIVDSITEISLDRGCFGCPNPYRLTLRRDGIAAMVYDGVARFGTVGRTLEASITNRDFLELAQLIVKGGFLDLLELYTHPTLMDGSTVVTTVTMSNGKKIVVTNRNEAGPQALREMESAIDAVGARLSWTPVRAHVR